MSADNWAVCPKCTDALARDVRDATVALDAAYGTVPMVEFDEMRADLDAKRARLESPPNNSRLTFREDYEIYGADEGVVTVDYQGGCKVCGLSVKFTHGHPIAYQDVTA